MAVYSSGRNCFWFHPNGRHHIGCEEVDELAGRTSGKLRNYWMFFERKIMRNIFGAVKEWYLEKNKKLVNKLELTSLV